MAKLRDRLWLWGQTAGSHNLVPEIALPKKSSMTPMEGLAYFGIPNMARCVYQGSPVYPYDAESKAMAGAPNVIWSILDQEARGRPEDAEGDVDEVAGQAKLYPNIVGAVVDDFFARGAHRNRYTADDILRLKKRLISGAGRPLDLWWVIYTRDICPEVVPFLRIGEVISLWTWHADMLGTLPAKMAELKRLAGEDRRYFVGCYLWDYGPSDDGAGREMPPDKMRYQLDLYHRWLKSGYIEGIVFCSNCNADIGLAAADCARAWIMAHGEEEIG